MPVMWNWKIKNEFVKQVLKLLQEYVVRKSSTNLEQNVEKQQKTKKYV